MNSKNTLIIGLLLLVFALGYQFNKSHATISGQWQSINKNKTITFFNDGTMNFKGMPAKYHWIGNDNMRIEISGFGGDIIKWIGGDIVVQVKLEHELVTSPTLAIRDTLTVKKTNGDKTKYRRIED